MHRRNYRERRAAVPIPVVALVGYTNAGRRAWSSECVLQVEVVAGQHPGLNPQPSACGSGAAAPRPRNLTPSHLHQPSTHTRRHPGNPHTHRQIDAVEHADQRWGAGGGQAVCHAGPHHPACGDGRRQGGAVHRHCGLYSKAAHPGAFMGARYMSALHVWPCTDIALLARLQLVAHSVVHLRSGK